MSAKATSAQLRMLQVANQPGPFYCFLRPLIFELMRRGIEVNVACNRGDPRFAKLAEAGMRTVPLTVGPWRRPSTWLTLRRELRRVLWGKQYDMCVVHTPAISWITRREAARAGVPVVAHMAHGLPFFERQGPMARGALLAVEKLCARYTDLLLLVNSDDARAAQSHHLIKPGGLIRHVPGPGVDVDRWGVPPAEAEVAALRDELHLAAETKLLLYMGRLMPTKGVLDMVEALGRLVRSGHDVALLVAGEGPSEEPMRRRAEALGLADRLRLLGWRDDGVRLMHAANVLLLLSTYREGLPTVLMEAGAAGKPVVAYRNRGSNDIVADGQTGYLVEPYQPGAVAEAVARLISDADLARQMGVAGAERIRTKFSYAAAVPAQLDAYARALEQKGYDASALHGAVGPAVFSLGPSTGQGTRP